MGSLETVPDAFSICSSRNGLPPKWPGNQERTGVSSSCVCCPWVVLVQWIWTALEKRIVMPLRWKLLSCSRRQAWGFHWKETDRQTDWLAQDTMWILGCYIRSHSWIKDKGWELHKRTQFWGFPTRHRDPWKSQEDSDRGMREDERETVFLRGWDPWERPRLKISSGKTEELGRAFCVLFSLL